MYNDVAQQDHQVMNRFLYEYARLCSQLGVNSHIMIDTVTAKSMTHVTQHKCNHNYDNELYLSKTHV